MGISISYDEVLRYRNGLAMFYILSSTNILPLPTNLNSKVFTTAVFDNSDHEEATLSGINGSHDTAGVLFQDESGYTNPKPNV